MNQEECEKFNSVLSNGFQDLITKRPTKPLHHFIYYILDTLPAQLRDRDALVKEFYD
jgi:hypothetical protein